MFNQSAFVLFSVAPSLDEIETVIGDFHVLGRTEQGDRPHWACDGEALVLSMQDSAGTGVIIDIVEHPWVDWPKPNEDQNLFQAFMQNAFGCYVTPGSMRRAAKQTWVWEGAKDAANNHKAMVRIRTTHFDLGNGEEQEEAEPLAPEVELRTITAIAANIAELEGALAYFNPAGESLRTAEFVKESMEWAEDEGCLPLDVWTNIRIGLIELGASWLVMDTIGMNQLNLPDIECCFENGKYNRGEVDTFLHNVADYVVSNGGDMLREGDVIDGPGNINWDIFVFDNPIANPMRKTIRLIPQDGTERPKLVLEREARDREPGFGAPAMPDFASFMPDGSDPNMIEKMNEELKAKAEAEAKKAAEGDSNETAAQNGASSDENK